MNTISTNLILRTREFGMLRGVGMTMKQMKKMINELCEHLEMTRQSVSKHLVILEEANLIVIEWHGRNKLHLNVAPIGEIYDRWIEKYERLRIEALTDLKKSLEEE